MTIASILKEKNVNKNILLVDYNFKNKEIPIGLIKLNNKLINGDLIDALKILPANFIIFGKNKNFNNNTNIVFYDNNLKNTGFDFIVCDEYDNFIIDYFKVGVIPVIGRSHNISNILKEFNAEKIEGNAFIFENNTLCDIYYAIIRYTENYKFPYDNKALIKNILKI